MEANISVLKIQSGTAIIEKENDRDRERERERDGEDRLASSLALAK